MTEVNRAMVEILAKRKQVPVQHSLLVGIKEIDAGMAYLACSVIPVEIRLEIDSGFIILNGGTTCTKGLCCLRVGD